MTTKEIKSTLTKTKTNFNYLIYKQMKKTIKSILTLTFVMGLGIMAHAQKTATAPASATVLADLSITLDGTQDEIAFGNLSATTPAAVVLDANGTANANTGTITNVAKFDLEGEDGAEVTISYSPTVTLENTDPTPATMIMTPEVVGAATDAEQATALVVVSSTTRALVSPDAVLFPGAYFLWVGGTIPTLASQAAGTYTGTFNIDVEYN